MADESVAHNGRHISATAQLWLQLTALIGFLMCVPFEIKNFSELRSL